MGNSGITIHREVLLIEIERRCTVQDCTARNFIGLTKVEALEYNGFECSECEQWNKDLLKQAEVPDSWDDINQETTH
jgi:hypothetical protein